MFLFCWRVGGEVWQMLDEEGGRKEGASGTRKIGRGGMVGEEEE